jgi:hypothetical protein
MKSREIWQIPDLHRLVNRQAKQLGQIEEQARRDGDEDLLQEVQHKRRRLRELQDVSEPKTAPGLRSLFISYPKRFQAAIEHVKRVARQDFGFETIRTGFDADVAGATTLKAGIIHAISSSSAFLGVWADDVQVKAGSKKAAAAPGVWMPIELGMAMALDKPFRLVMKEGISADFITPVMDLAHARFTEDLELTEASRDALRALNRRLDEQAKI